MPLSGCPASCLLPAHPTGVFPIRILCSVRYVCGFCLRWHRALVSPCGAVPPPSLWLLNIHFDSFTSLSTRCGVPRWRVSSENKSNATGF
jgi:hypothetical protein